MMIALSLRKLRRWWFVPCTWKARHRRALAHLNGEIPFWATSTGVLLMIVMLLLITFVAVKLFL